MNKESENLKEHGFNLFNTMETQAKSLSNEASKKTLNSAIEKARTTYNGPLVNTFQKPLKNYNCYTVTQ